MIYLAKILTELMLKYPEWLMVADALFTTALVVLVLLVLVREGE